MSRRRAPDEPVGSTAIKIPEVTLPALPQKKAQYNHAFMDIVGRPKELTRKKQSDFCDLLASCGNLTKAAMAVGTTPATVKRYMDNDSTFAEAVQLAKEAFAGDVEAELIRRAMEGVEDFKFNNKGEIVAQIRKFSDDLLKMLLKRHDTNYNEKSTVDHNVSGGLLVLTKNETEHPNEWKERYNEQDVPTIDVDAKPADDSSA